MSTSQVSIDRKNYKLTTADGDGDSALINDIRKGGREGGRGEVFSKPWLSWGWGDRI